MPRLVAAVEAVAAAPGDDAARRAVLVESLRISAQLAADEQLAPTARAKASAELRLLVELIAVEDARRAAATAIEVSPWAGIGQLEAV